ncbi:hypothetical protein STEG23_023731 [Scotinomys teguina]
MQPDQATNNGRTMELIAAAPRCQLLLIVLMAAMLLPGMKVAPLLIWRKIARTIELQENIGKDRGTPQSTPTPLKGEPVPDPQKTPPAHHKVSIFNCKQPQSLLKTQEQPVTLGRRGPKRNQSPLQEEDPGAASHPWRKRTKEQPVSPRGRGSRSTRTPLEQETSLDPSSKAEMGRRQCKSTYKNIKNKTSPESSPPPTTRPEHCNIDKAEENDLKNSLMKMIEEALEGKMKNAIKEIEENNKEIEENNKKEK